MATTEQAAFKSVLDFAQDLAGRGLAVFPCWGYRAGDKKICNCPKSAKCDKSPGKHPRTGHGLKDATTNAAQIQQWFTRWPRSLIGVVPGSATTFGADGKPLGTANYVVVDGDVGKKVEAVASIEQLQKLCGESVFSGTFCYPTPSGGFHSWYRAPEGIDVKSGNDKLGTGIDVKSDGGYVVYWAAHGYRSNALPIQDASPELLHQLLDGESLNGNGKFDRARAEKGAKKGEQNATLFPLACSDHRRRYTREEAKQHLREVGAKCEPPVSTTYTDKLVDRVYDKYPEPGVAHPYYAEHTGVYRVVKVKRDKETGEEQTVGKRVSPCTFLITHDRRRDNGDQEVSRDLTIQMTRGEHVAEANISAADFNARNLDSWLTTKFGPRAIVEAGEERHFIAATKHLSYPIAEQRIYLHTGWQQIDGVWRYLHAGCDDPEVELPGELTALRLPPAVGAEERKAAIRAALNLRRVSPNNPAIGYTTLAAPFLATLGILPDFVVAFTGQTGQGKSAVAAEAQNFFAAGAPFKFNHLPANWDKNSTALGIQLLLFHAKDAVMVVDEFRLKGLPPTERARQFEKLEAVVRAFADAHTSVHSDPKHKLHVGKRPRGLMILTAEEGVTERAGLVSRIHTVRFRPGDVDYHKLAQLHETEAPLYAVAMRGFTDWLAQNFTATQKAARATFTAQGEAMQRDGLHPRIAPAVGKLYTALKVMTDYELDEHALTDSEARELLDEARQALTTTSLDEQNAAQREANEVDEFFERVRAVLAARDGDCKAHLAATNGRVPAFSAECFNDQTARDYRQASGWHQRPAYGEWQPSGTCIGYIQTDKETSSVQIGLHPKLAYREASKLDRDHALISLNELGRRLRDDGRLVDYNANPGHHRVGTKQMRVNGEQLDLYWVKIEDIFGPDFKPEDPKDMENI
jgi:hypothetical protein